MSNPVGVLSTSEGLAAISQRDCAAAIWNRQTSTSFQAWIEDLDPLLLPEARIVVRPEQVRSAVADVCNAAGTPDCAERNQLIEDVTELATHFANLMKAPRIRLRFDVETTNSCRKFHIDAVKARLVCTYRGTGTEYGVLSEGAEVPETAFTLPTGVPMLMRGTLWPTTPVSRLRHRSPQIEGTGETRLLLVLDPIYEQD